MKIRLGFVSNSSSSSFFVSKMDLTDEQIEKIRDHQNCGEKFADEWPWIISEDVGTIKCSTVINNFDFLSYLNKIGINKSLIRTP